MKTSESIVNITAALLEAQKAITFAEKSAENPFFNSYYADLPTVIRSIKEPLNNNGIVFVQFASPGDPGLQTARLSLTTRLLHVSGEWMEDTASCPITKNDPQAFGSAMTYMRRYALAAAVGLYQDDDDANWATQDQAQQRQQPANRQQPAQRSPAPTPARAPAAPATTVAKTPAKPAPTPAPAAKTAPAPAKAAETKVVDKIPSAAKQAANAPVAGDWRQEIIHFGKRQGVPLGELQEDSLLWFITKWNPNAKEGYPASPADVRLRKALDVAGASMALPGFGEPPQDDAPDEDTDRIPGL